MDKHILELLRCLLDLVDVPASLIVVLLRAVAHFSIFFSILLPRLPYLLLLLVREDVFFRLVCRHLDVGVDRRINECFVAAVVVSSLLVVALRFDPSCSNDELVA